MRAITVVGLLLMGGSLLHVRDAMSGEPHRLVGTWSVDVSKIQQPDPPRRVTMVLAEAGEGQYAISVEIVASDGTITRAGSTFRPDGSAVRVQGSLDLDLASSSMPTDRVMIMGTAMNGHPASSRVYTLSDDGSHMIETVIRHLPDGTPYLRVFTWTRQ
jgi:hypothetical protein